MPLRLLTIPANHLPLYNCTFQPLEPSSDKASCSYSCDRRGAVWLDEHCKYATFRCLAYSDAGDWRECRGIRACNELCNPPGISRTLAGPARQARRRALAEQGIADMHVHRSQRTQGSRRALNPSAAAGATRASSIYKRLISLFGRWTRANKSSAAGPRQPPEGWHAPALWEGPKESQRVSKPAWWNQTRATGSEDHRPVPAWAVAPTAVSAARPTLPLNESFCKGATTHQKAARLAEARGFQPEGVGTVGELGRVLDRQGLIIYTHLRRTSGTMLEDCYIKPAIAHLIRRPAWAPMGATWNCIEGGEGRFGAPSATVFQRMAIEEKMRYTLFAYRHCPMGLHAFTSRPYTASERPPPNPASPP